MQLGPADFRLLTLPGFLERVECARWHEQLCTAGGSLAPVYGVRTNEGVDERTRRTVRLQAPLLLATRLQQVLTGLTKPLGEHFGVELTQFEEPQLLRYREGDFFVAHQDGNTGLMRGEREERRKVSVVLFVNAQSNEPAPGCYGGGDLVFSEWHPARRTGRYALPAEAGMLVAFAADTTHEVTPVTHGERFTVVSWFG